MNQDMDGLVDKFSKESQLRADTMERLLAAADSAKVFGPAVVSGQSTVITAAEIGAGGGFGSGMGVGLPHGRMMTAMVEGVETPKTRRLERAEAAVVVAAPWAGPWPLSPSTLMVFM